ncbi:transketolase family protein [Anaerotalea alkaliphila]|uniref:Transketolase family protein n=1 Tax=Anaerotalea alkaliphila TaxID=2662126 RepID=A0A7X5HXV1_9FIRM|nr:transketolase family protein [Anaerotalea alkaliphila]NDL68652.1 transketolase family protein [Anaerotalea alkaliphila]
MKMATRDAYGAFLSTYAMDHPDIVVLDADLSKSTKTAAFQTVCPDRFFNMGIAEQNLMGVSAGMATVGKIPFVSTFAMFAVGRALEILRNSVCYPKLNVKVCATHAGLTVGPDGASHQTVEDLALMRALPNLTVLNPADGISAQALLAAAAQLEGPVYVRLGRASVPLCYEEQEVFAIGKAKELRAGSEATIIATGIMVQESLQAAETLAKEGIEVRVLDMHTIKPIDQEAILKAAEETGAFVTVEEHSVIGGLGSAVAEVLAENFPVPMKRIGIKDVFGESGEPEELLAAHGLTAQKIEEAVKGVLGRR